MYGWVCACMHACVNLGTNHKYPDCQGILVYQVSFYGKAAPFRTVSM